MVDCGKVDGRRLGGGWWIVGWLRLGRWMVDVGLWYG